MSRPWSRRRDGTLQRVNDDDTRSTVWGVAGSGQRSRQGVVQLTEHKTGRVDANVTPEPVTLSTIVGSKPRPDTRPTSTTGTFRMTVLDDDATYIHLRDVERLLHESGYGYLADLLVRACGQTPDHQRIVIPDQIIVP